LVLQKYFYELDRYFPILAIQEVPHDLWKVAVLELKRLDALALAASMIQTWIRADLCKRWLVRTFAVRIAIQSSIPSFDAVKY